MSIHRIDSHLPMRIATLNGGDVNAHGGAIPLFLYDTDPRPAAEQFNDNYEHGGGWSPMKGWTLRDDDSIKYPGDPALKPRVVITLRAERIIIYDMAFVAIIQPDRSFDVSRMD